MLPNLQVSTYYGTDISPFIPAIAALRIKVFKEYPYLYAGSRAYEEQYLNSYCQARDALVVVIVDPDTQAIVGVSTGLPMSQAETVFQLALKKRQVDPESLYYCGESILEPAYRGRGIYPSLFDYRERHGRQLGLTESVFAAVVRTPESHYGRSALALRPNGYRSLADKWRRLGYQPWQGMQVELSWPTIGSQDDENLHTLQYWHKSINN